MSIGRLQAPADNKVSHTPDPPSKVVSSKADQLQRAEEKVQQAVNLSEIDGDSFMNVTAKAARPQVMSQQHAADDYASFRLTT